MLLQDSLRWVYDQFHVNSIILIFWCACLPIRQAAPFFLTMYSNYYKYYRGSAAFAPNDFTL